MSQHDVEVPTPDGTSPASLHVPDGLGPRPGVLMYPDAAGLRDTMRDMGEHLAALGYVTLVPDFYYRQPGWAPFDARTVFSDPDERERLMGMAHSVSVDMAARDAAAYVDFLLGRPETTGAAVGTTGYCLGGRLSLLAAGRLGERIAAAASFHGGNLAADDPDSPHHRAGSITAAVYVAGASDDGSFPDEQRDRLAAALTAAGVRHTIETYPAAHGFAVPDNDTYDPAAADRHWDALETLYGTHLG